MRRSDAVRTLGAQSEQVVWLFVASCTTVIILTVVAELSLYQYSVGIIDQLWLLLLIDDGYLNNIFRYCTQPNELTDETAKLPPFRLPSSTIVVTTQ